MSKLNYEDIKDSVVFSYEEYIDDEGYDCAQAAARILEEDWRDLNFNHISKAYYFILIGIESISRNSIADFILEKLKQYLEIDINSEELESFEIEQIQEDIMRCSQLLKEKNYSVIETTYETKNRVEYILSLKSNQSK